MIGTYAKGRTAVFMASLHKNHSLRDFQKLIYDIYSLPDDRLYSLWDLLTQQQRFTMRALKGIRKQDSIKLKGNLLIAFSWLMAIANRLHIDVEEDVWRRFPLFCSYCGRKPCACKKIKPEARKNVILKKNVQRPKTLREFQEMFQDIYPPEGRTLADAGVHLAEEMGEVSVGAREHKRRYLRTKHFSAHAF
jgi:NTP pyrophosphatase (non-canonical NTP hydrolase)